MNFGERFRLTPDEVERRLGRRLSGDPASGERGVLNALQQLRIEEVERSLQLDRSLKQDFVSVVREKLESGREEWCEQHRWWVTLSPEAYKVYRAMAMDSRSSLTRSLSDELERNLVRQDLESAAREAVQTGDLSGLRLVLERLAPAAGERPARASAVH